MNFKQSVVFLVGFVICLSSEIFAADGNSNEIIVTTSLGKIRGTTLKSRLGKSFLAFRGIRYAKPPVGDLRFQAPVPVEPWTDTFDATDDGPMCPQPPRNNSDMSEDCLRINVYTHELPSPGCPKKPVIIYLHPGGLYAVSGQSKNYAGPQIFMDRDIVFVALNYRIGTLGFMATGTKEAPGNAGFKDQVLAFKWVKEHISKFNGDPNSVTLLGYSAGGLSISLHLVSPMSRNLFHKAAVMSASALGQFNIPNHQIHLAQRQAKLLECPQNGITEMVNCLKQKDISEYAGTLGDMFEFGAFNPVLLYYPVVEPDFGQERFLVEDPVKSYVKGNMMRIPIITGITKDEFASPAIEILSNETLRNEMDKNWDTNAPICFLYERDTERSKYISRELRSLYLGNEPFTFEKSLTGLHHSFRDGATGYEIHRFSHLAARFTTVYYYKFSYQGRYSTYLYEGKPFGVVHHDDLLYLLNGIPYQENDPELKTVERLTRIHSHFAKTGNPNNPRDKYLRNLRWTPLNLRRENYLDIGEELVMKTHLYTDKYYVWDRLFPLSNRV